MIIRKNRSIILILIYFLLGIYFFVLGENGIFERMQLMRYGKGIKSNIARLTQENKNLQKEYSIIGNTRTNGSFYKEEASKSGFITSGEKYIFFKNGEKKDKKIKENISAENKYSIDISHLRIFWLVSSIIILSLYIWYRNTKNKENGENL